ncbi:putative ABC transporter permease [Isobaculum melis]|uniref:Uncharacterized membrane protein n=1 Tax=Isobaculum melis TaxID=142588 RepID=A0A1H9TC94_9LACT|nr:putative ABC transporter permease [Isobaculum melis]SER94865.1 Uncharacterized membrane protein [Isobaculum melis]
MEKTFSKLILLFFIYAIMGWLWETIYCSLKQGKFVYRGFLFGPYCPIYGFGLIGVVYLVAPFQKNLFLLFIFSSLIVSILEYFTSYFMEKLFHTTWWSYEDVPFNLNGRIALPISIFWGIACVFVVKVIHPLADQWVSWLNTHFGITLPIVLLILLLIDTIASIMSMNAFQKMVHQLNTELETKLEEAKTAVTDFEKAFDKKQHLLSAKWKNKREAWLKEVKENPILFSKLPKFNFNQRRFLKSYTQMKMKDIKDFKAFKQHLLNLDEIKKQLKK